MLHTILENNADSLLPRFDWQTDRKRALSCTGAVETPGDAGVRMCDPVRRAPLRARRATSPVQTAGVRSSASCGVRNDGHKMSD